MNVFSASMICVAGNSRASLYQINTWVPFTPPNLPHEKNFRCFVGSTPESRAITNDPFVLGVDYTTKLRTACEQLFPLLKENVPYFPAIETEATVVNILRGGLNFGLREALSNCFGWNVHNSAFISAQRARRSEKPDDWFITETAYRKVYLPKCSSLFIADVVATGVSLDYALGELLRLVEENNSEIRSLVFVTIGGIRAAEHMAKLHRACEKRLKHFEGSIVLFLEGCFAVAANDSPVSLKITDTDLLRRDSIVAPEFVQSQYEDPAYPLERCTIYDAGSRAFWVPEYLEDVIDYWEQNLELARSGTDFSQLLNERMPGLERANYQSVELAALSERQIIRAYSLLKTQAGGNPAILKPQVDKTADSALLDRDSELVRNQVHGLSLASTQFKQEKEEI